MRTKALRAILAVLVLMSILTAGAMAEAGAIRTYLTFRITTETQSAIVDVGEDLQIEVGVEGIEPTGYQWYYEGKAIEKNGNERIYNLLTAMPEDAGIYTMEAYVGDELALKVEVNVRVINPTVIPASGDHSVPVEAAFAALTVVSLAILVLIRKRRVCA